LDGRAFVSTDPLSLAANFLLARYSGAIGPVMLAKRREGQSRWCGG